MATEWQFDADELTSPSKPGVVTYFVQASHGGPIKIGRSTKGGLKSRLASIQTGCPYPLVVTRTMDGDYEADLHEQFAEHRLSGEWFSPAREVALFSGAKLEGEGMDDHTQASFSAGYEAGYAAGHEDSLHDLRGRLKRFGEQLDLLRRYAEYGAPSSTGDRRRDAFKRFIRERAGGQ